MRTEAQKLAERKYKSNQTVFYGIRLNRKTDAGLIQMLEGKNKNAIIKEALRLKKRRDACIVDADKFCETA